MRKWITILLFVALVFSLAACGRTPGGSGQTQESTSEQKTEGDTQLTGQPFEDNDQPDESTENTEDMTDTDVLVVYFSATGTTRPIAKQMAEILDADLYEIVPAEAYSEADLRPPLKTARF